MKFSKIFLCPSMDSECPYWKSNGTCALVDCGDDPLVECDDAGSAWKNHEYAFIWRDENGKLYDPLLPSDVMELLEKGYHIVNGEAILPLDFSSNP